jgi:hypothetical protein
VGHVREQVATHFAHVFRLEWAEQQVETSKDIEKGKF